jgi:hypothetical protein
LKTNKALGVAFCLVLVAVGGSIFVIISIQEQISNHQKLGLATSGYDFGSRGNSLMGWLVPANILISTTYVSTEILNYSLIGSLIVFQYGSSGQTIRLGLYENGELKASDGYVTNWNQSEQATPDAPITGQVANFSYVTTEYAVSLFPLSSQIPKGVTVTVVAEFSSPLWVEVDSSPTTNSYESSVGTNTSSFAAQITPDSGSFAPYTLSTAMGGD